jgi:tetratricopeptide (TPR) repeat protein
MDVNVNVLRNRQAERFVVTADCKEYESWRDAWRVAVAVLNRYRNPLMRRFRVPLLFVGAPWLQVLLREIAPDLWSVCSLVVRVEPEIKAEREPEPVAPPRPDWIDEDAPDPEFAMQMAERLRGQSGQELQLAGLLHRAGKGYLARFQSKLAEKTLSAAIELKRRYTSISDDLADALNDLSWALAWQHRFVEATENLEEAWRIYRQTRSIRGEAECIRRLGNIALWKSDYTTAKERHQQALSLYREIGDARGEAIRRSDQAEARRNFKTALTLFEQLEEPFRIGSTHLRLARVAENEPERNQHIQAARAVWERIDRSDLVKQLDEEFG